MSDFVDNEKQFALLVIGNLDERGYLDLKGEDPEGEKRPDLTLDDLAPRRSSIRRTRPRSSR
jgi:RNA polymerase sigma-54 factor